MSKILLACGGSPLSDFKEYLLKERQHINSVKRYVWQLKDYENWCKKQGVNNRLIDYKILLKYVKHLQAKNWKAATVNNQLRCVKYYFDYLIAVGFRLDNPAEEVKVKREKTNVLKHLLSSDELEDLYYSFESDNVTDTYFKATAKRNKVITGLIVYQGLNSTSLAKLQIEHLQLYKGKIYVPRTLKSNNRTLVLKSWQVIEMMWSVYL